MKITRICTPTFCTTSNFFLILSGRAISGRCNQIQIELFESVTMLGFCFPILRRFEMVTICDVCAIKIRRTSRLSFHFKTTISTSKPSHFFRFSCSNFFWISFSIFSKCARGICAFLQKKFG